MPPPKVAKTVSLIAGLLFLLIALANWLPNPVFGAEGFFAGDAGLSAVFGIAGVILIFASTQGESMAALGLWSVAAALLVLAITGYTQVVQATYGAQQLFGVFRFNAADTWLCLGLSCTLGVSGFLNTGSKQVIRE